MATKFEEAFVQIISWIILILIVISFIYLDVFEAFGTMIGLLIGHWIIRKIMGVD